MGKGSVWTKSPKVHELINHGVELNLNGAVEVAQVPETAEGYLKPMAREEAAY